MIKSRKQALICIPAVLFTVALYAYSSYSLWYEFLWWTNLVNVGIYSGLCALCYGAVCFMNGAVSGKKERTVKNAVLSSVGGIAAFLLLFFGITFLHNTDGKTNYIAIRAATVFLAVLLGVLCIVLFIRLSRISLKGLMITLSALTAIAAITVSVCISFKYFPTQVFYKPYRLFCQSGGISAGDDVYYTFAPSTQKAQPTMNLDENDSITLHFAKNEREGFQLFVSSRKDDRFVSLEVTDFTGTDGSLPVKIYREVYNETGEKKTFFSNEFADALVEIQQNESIKLEKNRVQAFYIETLSSADTSAGTYNAEVILHTGKDGSDGQTANTNVTAEIWDFTLPETPSSQTAIGISGGKFYELNGVVESDYKDEEAYKEARSALYKEYYDFLLDHKISAYTLPYDILDERADSYMSDPRVTSFLVPYPDDDEKLAEYYEKVTSNPEWASKAYFYPIDEPCDEDAINRYNEITSRLEKLCPGYNMVTPFCVWQVEIGEEKVSMIELQKDKSSILCGCSNQVAEGENTLQEMYDARDKLGSRLWFYVCCGPQGQYNNMFIYLDAIQHRELFWQEKMLDLTGFLYWSSTYYEKGNPWETGKTWDDYGSSGDGCLIYPGAYAGLEGPVGTVRLKNITDGLEDYDYLTLAEQKFGKAWVDERIEKISTGICDFNMSYDVLENVRIEIGNALSGK